MQAMLVWLVLFPVATVGSSLSISFLWELQADVHLAGAVAFHLAVSRVNRDASILPDFVLEPFYRDCSSEQTALSGAVDLSLLGSEVNPLPTHACIPHPPHIPHGTIS